MPALAFLSCIIKLWQLETGEILSWLVLCILHQGELIFYIRRRGISWAKKSLLAIFYLGSQRWLERWLRLKVFGYSFKHYGSKQRRNSKHQQHLLLGKTREGKVAVAYPPSCSQGNPFDWPLSSAHTRGLIKTQKDQFKV